MMNTLYVCFGDTKKQKQTNYKTCGCLTEKKSINTKIEKNNWVLSCIIYLWMKNKQKIQFATQKDY